jgi:hypothetical protein
MFHTENYITDFNAIWYPGTQTESSEENVICIPYKRCLCESEITLDHISKKNASSQKSVCSIKYRYG